MPFMVIISNDMGNVSIHDECEKETVLQLIKSASMDEQVEILEYSQIMTIEEFKTKY